jgi:hypothetical protein
MARLEQTGSGGPPSREPRSRRKGHTPMPRSTHNISIRAKTSGFGALVWFGAMAGHLVSRTLALVAKCSFIERLCTARARVLPARFPWTAVAPPPHRGRTLPFGLLLFYRLCFDVLLHPKMSSSADVRSNSGCPPRCDCRPQLLTTPCVPALRRRRRHLPTTEPHERRRALVRSVCIPTALRAAIVSGPVSVRGGKPAAPSSPSDQQARAEPASSLMAASVSVAAGRMPTTNREILPADIPSLSQSHKSLQALHSPHRSPPLSLSLSAFGVSPLPTSDPHPYRAGKSMLTTSPTAASISTPPSGTLSTHVLPLGPLTTQAPQCGSPV